MKTQQNIIDKLAKKYPAGFCYYSVGYKTERGYNFTAHYEDIQEAKKEAEKQGLTAYKNWSWKTDTVDVRELNYLD